jgi:hypothetical protein
VLWRKDHDIGMVTLFALYVNYDLYTFASP